MSYFRRYRNTQRKGTGYARMMSYLWVTHFFLLDTTGRFTWRNRFFVKEKRVWASACALDLCHLYVIAQMGCIGYFYQDPEYISKKEDRLKSFIERKQRWWAHLYHIYIYVYIFGNRSCSPPQRKSWCIRITFFNPICSYSKCVLIRGPTLTWDLHLGFQLIYVPIGYTVSMAVAYVSAVLDSLLQRLWVSSKF